MRSQNHIIRVIILGKHHLVRAAIADYLSKNPDIEVVEQIENRGNLTASINELNPDVIIIDVNNPKIDAVDFVLNLYKNNPHINILILSSSNHPEHVTRLLQGGVSGFILKDDEPEDLVAAVQKISRGNRWISPQLTAILVESYQTIQENKNIPLTKRERDVLNIMVTGASNQEIADMLVITPFTVKNHVSNIFQKLDVTSRVEAVVYAIDNNLTSTTSQNS